MSSTDEIPTSEPTRRQLQYLATHEMKPVADPPIPPPGQSKGGFIGKTHSSLIDAYRSWG